jgi:hypothetical protein
VLLLADVGARSEGKERLWQTARLQMPGSGAWAEKEQRASELASERGYTPLRHRNNEINK